MSPGYDQHATPRENPKLISSQSSSRQWKENLRRDCLERAKTARRQRLLKRRSEGSFVDASDHSWGSTASGRKRAKREGENFEKSYGVDDDHHTATMSKNLSYSADEDSLQRAAKALVEREFQRTMMRLRHSHQSLELSQKDYMMKGSYLTDKAGDINMNDIDADFRVEEECKMSDEEYLELLNTVTEELEREDEMLEEEVWEMERLEALEREQILNDIDDFESWEAEQIQQYQMQNNHQSHTIICTSLNSLETSPLVACPICNSKSLIETPFDGIKCTNEFDTGSSCNFRLDIAHDGLSLQHLQSHLASLYEEHSKECMKGMLKFRMENRGEPKQTMDGDDANGHRYGNFPNYYSFNPPENRLDVLERAKILDYILAGLSTPTSSVIGDGSPAPKEEAANVDCGQRKKPRLDDKSSYKQSNARISRNGNDSQVINYCDLGCNEGDLTMAMAAVLSNSYITHSESNAVTSAREIKQTKVKCLGLDIDSKLIERANAKYSSSAAKTGEESNIDYTMVDTPKSISVSASFKTANLCNAIEHNGSALSFGRVNGQKVYSKSDINKELNLNLDEEITPEQVFDLTTIFCTTMWIHVHAGDKGLEAFLKRACRWTKKFLLIEPQPSSCYRKANVRLRKMGLQELSNVTSASLKLRQAIEEEIERIVLEEGFHPVHVDVKSGTFKQKDDAVNKADIITSWNRSLQLYERDTETK